MTDLQLRIIARAARIRVGLGMDLDDVLACWPALGDEDRAKVRAMLEGEGVTDWTR